MPAGEADAELRLLVGRRRELVTDQTRRIGRLRDLLASIHPGLERVIDPTHKVDAALLARYVTPTEIRLAANPPPRMRRQPTRKIKHSASVKRT
jgi:hypothetical protein